MHKNNERNLVENKTNLSFELSCSNEKQVGLRSLLVNYCCIKIYYYSRLIFANFCIVDWIAIHNIRNIKWNHKNLCLTCVYWNIEITIAFMLIAIYI
jgi:hypothetical protein